MTTKTKDNNNNNKTTKMQKKCIHNCKLDKHKYCICWICINNKGRLQRHVYSMQYKWRLKHLMQEKEAPRYIHKTTKQKNG